MSIACPHCNAANEAPASFCTACGKALPTPQSGPRIVGKQEFASSAAGQNLQLDELRKQSRTAAKIMFILGGLQLVLGVGLAALSQAMPADRVDPTAIRIAGVVVAAIGVIFLGLGFWARKSPLPASITALVVYCSLFAIDVVSSLGGDHPEAATRGIIIKIIIIAALAKAVSAGMKHRALSRQMAVA